MTTPDPLRALRDYVFASLTIPPLDRRRICEAIDALRAALAADTAPLDVERLAQALHDQYATKDAVYGDDRCRHREDAQEICAALAVRLAKERDQG